MESSSRCRIESQAYRRRGFPDPQHFLASPDETRDRPASTATTPDKANSMPGTKAAAVAGVKRKRETGNPKASSKRRASAARQDDDAQTEVLRLEAEVIESRKHYNNIATLLQKAKDESSESEAAILAAVALCRIFARLLSGGDMVKSKGLSQSEALIVSWLKERYREYAGLLLDHLRCTDARKQSTALTLLLRTVKEESKQKDYSWKKTPLSQAVESLLLVEEDATREEFSEKYFTKFDDIRFYTFKIIK